MPQIVSDLSGREGDTTLFASRLSPFGKFTPLSGEVTDNLSLVALTDRISGRAGVRVFATANTEVREAPF